jgi:hypothetical protein
MPLAIYSHVSRALERRAAARLDTVLMDGKYAGLLSGRRCRRSAQSSKDARTLINGQ